MTPENDSDIPYFDQISMVKAIFPPSCSEDEILFLSSVSNFDISLSTVLREGTGNLGFNSMRKLLNSLFSTILVGETAGSDKHYELSH